MNEVVPTTEAAGTEESKQAATVGADEVDEKKRLANQKKK
jgi:hypothetical protein